MKTNSLLELLVLNLHGHGLASDHIADLRKSGLTDHTIALQRFRSVSGQMIQQLLGFAPRSIASALLIPFSDTAGGFMNHVRLKVFPPFKDQRGKTVKYLQPRRSGVHLFFPLATVTDVLKSHRSVWLVEGEKKALAVAQLGLPAVGICGIEGWHDGGSRELLPDFDAIPLDGRTVELVPDGDVTSNRNVRRAVERFATALVERGAAPRLVVLPERLAP